MRYLIYIAITALARTLVEIVGAEHRTGIDVVMLTAAILLLATSALILRFGSYKFPSSDVPPTDLVKPHKE